MHLTQEQITELNKYIELGYISVRPHPTLPLNVYKYSKTWEIDARSFTKSNAEYLKQWTPLMMRLRGLVLSHEYEIISTPFRKFFNIQDHDYQYPQTPFIVYEKLDGSAIVLSRWDDKLIINTLGSFESEQAIKAQELLFQQYAEHLPTIQEGFTYVFEIVYKQNQIVIRYDEERLVLLSVCDHHRSYDIQCHPWPHKPKLYPFQDLNHLITQLNTSPFNAEEGYVVFWPDEDVRIKFKFQEYMRIHKIRSQLSPKYIWELLSSGKDIEDLLDLPDEFVIEVQQIKDKLLNDFRDIERKALHRVKEIIIHLPGGGDDRAIKKQFASEVAQDPMAPLLFAIFNKKQHSKVIWKMLEPEFGEKLSFDNVNTF
jgi:hypothetical protein